MALLLRWRVVRRSELLNQNQDSWCSIASLLRVQSASTMTTISGGSVCKRSNSTSESVAFSPFLGVIQNDRLGSHTARDLRRLIRAVVRHYNDAAVPPEVDYIARASALEVGPHGPRRAILIPGPAGKMENRIDVGIVLH